MKSTDNQFDDARLDQLLKKYGAAEPRTGLEGRVLAHLADERAHSTAWGWRRSLIVAALALGATAAVTIFVVRKPAVRHESAASRPPLINTIQQEIPVAILKPTPHASAKLPRLSQRKTQIKGPRLDQFPSPAPLNEQEVMLAQYVQQRHPEAVMVARARAQLEKQELARFQQGLPIEQTHSE